MSPLIGPPKSLEVEVTPKTLEPITTFSGEHLARIQAFMDAGTWKCPNCGCIVHNWTKICPYNRKGFTCHTKKPDIT